MHRFNPLPAVCLIALALLVGACGGEQDAADMPDADTTVTVMETPGMVTVAGTLIDSKCYGLDHANTGNDHTMPACGSACATMGLPVAVLEGGQQDAKVYLLVTASAPLADHMAKEVRVSGTAVYESGLIPSKIEVKDAQGQWMEVSTATM